ncbi:NAD(P)/FAD-dependent oxidoreductase [Hahella sp. KA22]|uniref:NAD(P)/FAD-dependent oxidoreductase n=1 Tax=Hahella sp. KA22 TaxID=1628392 RepID=UPI000FDEF1A6|nr:FAD-dependent oxidoreductase [Hahella sp. KA22]AZZ93203.1 NAD(P)/FAD-dependent oxidoreductase [Hahella sp. KA22]QAY56576.1 NAD(P)/FAD-dependent oxidoreductase [Hahella sp. KA22]
MATIVILGAGLGGMPMAFELRETLSKDHRIVVVSDKDYFHFVPSNPWVAIGWREPEAIKIPLQSPLSGKGVELVVGAAQKVDPAASLIELKNGDSISYDHLIIATGPRLAFDEIPGLGPGGYTQSICHIDHAIKANQKWREFVEDPGPIVVGAVQGASCFGPAYEFAFIMDRDLRKRRIRDKVPMTFVTSEPYIGHLGLGGVGDSKGMLESQLRQRHIDWVCNAKVESVDDKLMTVMEVDEMGEDKHRRELPFKYSMMLPAFTGIDALREVEGLVNPRGFVVIDKHQRNPTYPNVWGIGVAVAIAPKEKTPVPTGVPKTGYMIESMATAVAKNIQATLAGAEPKAEATWNAVCLADMGDTGIAFVAIPQLPPRNVNWMREGKWVHVAKVAFEKYFLLKLRKGSTEPLFERYILKAFGIERLKVPS